MNGLKDFWHYLKTKEISWADVSGALPLLPGLFFLLIGAALLYAPQYLIGIVAAFFLFAGIAFTYLSYKFAKLMGTLRRLSSEFEAKIYVHGFNVRAGNDLESVNPTDQKKIVYH